MSDRLKALRERRGKIVAEMKALTDASETEKRDLTEEQLAKHGKLFDEQEGLRKQVEAEERQAELDRQMAAVAADEQRAPKPGAGGEGAKTPDERRALAFRRWLTGGNAFAGAGAEEFRALQADADVSGGYLVAPQLFVQQLIKAIDDEVFIRGMATTFQVPMAQSLGAPSLDADPDDADWTSELATGSEDSAMAFGKRELYPRPLAKRIKVSNKLLRMGLMGPEALVTGRLAYKFAITQEKAFLTGTGAGRPLGVFIASTDGIATGRDVSTGNTTTSITFDGLIEAKYALKSGYQRASTWLFHRDAVKQISKLKDGEGQYLWRPSVREGDPDMVLGRPMRMSEYAPNTFTTGLYVGIIGDFSYYWIADALAMQMQRLVELYAETNQTGFIGRLETDGMPVLGEAFARVKLA